MSVADAFGGSPHPLVPQPWWIIEMLVPADNHLDEPHVHVDHQYVAIADSPVPVSEPVHPFGWYGMDELDELPMFPDTALLAKARAGAVVIHSPIVATRDPGLRVAPVCTSGAR